MNTQVESQRQLLRGGEFEEQALGHAETGEPMLVISTPGTGKTEKSAALADEPVMKEIMGYGPEESIPCAVVPAQQAPEEAIRGIPTKRTLPDGSTTLDWVLPPDFVKRPMILVLDEINRAKSHVRDAMFPLLTGHPMINGFRLHPKSLVVLLGNDPSHHVGAKDMDSALHLRVTDYDFEPDLGDWTSRYAIPKGVHVDVQFYLKAFPECFNRFDPNGPKNQPCPRTWAKAAGFWSLKRFTHLQKEKAIKGSVGSLDGEQFVAWAMNYQGVIPTEEKIAEAPHAVAIPDGLDAPAMLARSMGQILGQRQDQSVNLANGAAIILTRLAAAGYVEHATKALRDAMKPMFTGTPVRLAFPVVQATLRGNHQLMEVVMEVGRQQADGAMR